MPKLFVLKLVLQAGPILELAFTDEKVANAAMETVCAGGGAEGNQPIRIVDDFGHALFVRPGDIASNMLVDIHGDLALAQALAELRQHAQEAFQRAVQQRQAAAGRLLVPGGPVAPLGPFVNGGRA